MFALVSGDRVRLLGHSGASVSALRFFELLPRHPVVSVSLVMKLTGTSKPTAGRAVESLASAGILVETTGKKRDRSWTYQAYLEHLRLGTELATGP